TTFGTEQEARKMALELVSQGLAACANINPGVRSIYRWQGAVEETQESVMLVKTREGLNDGVVSFIGSHHSYSVPVILVLEPSEVHPPYLDWLIKETQPAVLNASSDASSCG